MVHPITSKYDEMKELFNIAPLNAGITDKFKEMNDMCYNNLGMYHIQRKQKSRLFKTLICSECDTAGLYQVA